MKNLLSVVIAVFSTLGCNPEKYKVVKPNEFQPYSMPAGKRQIEITLLRSFILDKECNDNSETKYADAFLTKVDATNDTVLVLSVCRRTFDFLKPKYKGSLWLAIDSVNIATHYPKEVVTNIDHSLDAKKYKILIAEINNLKD